MSILVDRLALEGTISSITTLNIVNAVYCSDPSQNNAKLLTSLHSKKLLNRLIIDEAHEIILAEEYRSKLSNISELREVAAVPIVLLSATIPTQFKEHLDKIFQTSFICSREKTYRKNLKYFVDIRDYSSEQSLLNLILLKAIKKSEKLNNEERLLIYCKTRDTCESFFQALRSKTTLCFMYHAKLTPEEKESALLSWKQSGKIMVATTAIGCGINYPHVREIIIIEGCYSIPEFAQQSGRAGRDGKESTCTIYASNSQLSKQRKLAGVYSLNLAQQLQIDFLEIMALSKNQCWRKLVHKKLDGFGEDCMSLNVVMCGYCETIMNGTYHNPEKDEVVVVEETIQVTSKRPANFKSQSPKKVAPEIQQSQQRVFQSNLDVVADYNRLKDVLKSWRKCFMCNTYHKFILSCKYLDYRCSFCLDQNHNQSKESTEKCPNKGDPSNGSCYYCGLPLNSSLGANCPKFHSNDSITHPSHCDSGAKDKLFLLAFYLYENKDKYLRIQSTFPHFTKDKNSFATWLRSSNSNGTKNVVKVALFCNSMITPLK
jgi:superfamily II DNA helicase RecQ